MRTAADSSERGKGSFRQTGEGWGAVKSDARHTVFSHRRFRRTFYLHWQLNLVAFTILFVSVLVLLVRLAWIG